MSVTLLGAIATACGVTAVARLLGIIDGRSRPALAMGPTAALMTGSDPTPVKAEARSPARPVRARPVLLIVDDEPAVRELTSRMARRLGYAVLSAGDGQEAVDVFRRHADAVACVVLDVRMPRHDGIAAFGVLRGLRSDLPIILCSGYCDPRAAETLNHEPRTCYLAKPFTFAHFRDALAQILSDQPNTPPS